MGGLIPASLNDANTPPSMDAHRDPPAAMDGGYGAPDMGPPPPMGGPGLAPAPRPLAPLPLAPPPEPAPAPMPAPMAPPVAARPLAPAPMPGPAPVQAPAPALAPAMASAPPPASAPAPAARSIAPPPPAAPIAEARTGEEYPDLLAQVIRTARQRGADATPGDDASRQRAKPLVDQAARSVTQLPSGVTHDRLSRDALAEIAGAGAWDAVRDDGEVTLVSVDHRGRVSTLRGGQWNAGSHWFSSAAAAAECTDRLLRASGVDRGAKSSVHATFHDGAVLTALFGALSHGGVVAQLERPARGGTLNDLAARGALPPQAVSMLLSVLSQRRNVIVSGGRGSGRSTVLAALVASLPAGDRAVVIEDRDEVNRARRDALSVRAEGDWSAAVDAALGLRAGRVVYGEAHPACAKAFVTSLATGAEGAMIAVAAPTGAHAIAKLAHDAAEEGWLSRDEATTRLLDTRPFVVETARFGDGVCRIISIGEAYKDNDGSTQVAKMFAVQISGPDNAGNLVVQLVPAQQGY